MKRVMKRYAASAGRPRAVLGSRRAVDVGDLVHPCPHGALITRVRCGGLRMPRDAAKGHYRARSRNTFEPDISYLFSSPRYLI